MKKLLLGIALMAPLCSFAQLADSTQRLVHMRGALNFRDVGGYKTANGRQVKWHRVFRSASIQRLTPADMDTMEARHIYTVIDFRGKQESAQAPDRLLPHTDYTLSPAGSDDGMMSKERMAESFRADGFLEEFYGKGGVRYFGERYRPLFNKLLTLNDTTALLYHCTGGRDRTGMATALFLYVLGVPRETINQDFVASNIYLKPMMGKMMQPLVEQTGMTVEQLNKKMELHPGLLDIFFDTLKSSYGSVEAFLQKELGVGDAEIRLLRDKYTI